MECPICLESKPLTTYNQGLYCAHQFCTQCLLSHIQVLLNHN